MDILRLLAEKPHLYVGESNLVKVKAFLDGYATCAYVNGLDYDEDGARAFQQYVEDRLVGNRTAMAWTTIFRERCDAEDEAFDLFVKLLGEYVRNQG